MQICATSRIPLTVIAHESNAPPQGYAAQHTLTARSLHAHCTLAARTALVGPTHSAAVPQGGPIRSNMYGLLCLRLERARRGQHELGMEELRELDRVCAEQRTQPLVHL
jgi:hypothetical protein